MDHKKNVLLIYAQKKAVLRQIQVWPFSCLLLSSSSLPEKRIALKFYYNIISLPWGPCLFLQEQLICLSQRKTRWTMSVDNISFKLCLLGTSNSMTTLAFFPCCKLKWSRYKFNTQSHIFRTLGRLHSPWCVQPLMHLTKLSTLHCSMTF